MSNAQAAILNEFLLESFENLSTINEELTRYEKNPDDDELINSIYRKVHTVKGSASFLGFTRLENLTHTTETLLDNVRDKTIKVDSELIDLFLESFDSCIEILKAVQETGLESEKDFSKLTGNLVKALEVRLLKDESPSNTEIVKDSTATTEPAIVEEPVVAKETVEESVKEVAKEVSPELSIVEPVAEVKATKVEEPAPVAKTPEVVKPKSVEKPTQNLSNGNINDSTVRVNVNLLDKIMNVVGELVLNRNQILQYSKSNDDADLNRFAQQLNVITTELQTDIMTTRMQPVGSVFNKFERIVRDLSRGQNKKIKLDIQGKDTELDKTLLEIVKDPMTHLVRNAVDHGIETPDQRFANGKSEEGLLSIRAYHEGGQVIIEIADDGNGINTDKILNKAISKGLVTEEEGERLSQTKILNFIFAPGFSTAEKVTNISGRGVGMDVVKSNVEKIGGEVEVFSSEGQGSTFKLKIPLTLAIVPALLVQSSGEYFAIHQKNLVELVLLEEEQISQIEKIHGHEFFRLRGDLVPMFRLNNSLEMETPEKEHELLHIIVLKAEGKTYGLIVDEIIDTQEIVVKPLSRKLKNLSVYAGATIMGDGSVALIIDAFGFYNMVDLGKIKEEERGIGNNSDIGKNKYAELQEILLFELGDDREYGIPLCLINRLEEFKISDIEWSGEKPLMKYRNMAMPLINLESSLNLKGESFIATESPSDSDVMPVLVAVINGHHLGFVVKKIIDIAVTDDDIDQENVDRSGMMGTLFIDEKIVTVIDIHEISGTKKVSQGRAVQEADTPLGNINLNGKVLLVEDSPLYRKIQLELFQESGLEVVVATNGKEGLEKLKSFDDIDAIVTDIEMPEMNGWDMVREIRGSSGKHKDLPICAVSTRVSPKDRKLGVEVGINDHLEKLNKDEVVGVLTKYING